MNGSAGEKDGLLNETGREIASIFLVGTFIMHANYLADAKFVICDVSQQRNSYQRRSERITRPRTNVQKPHRSSALVADANA